ncbi:hypothetical protein, partial [Leisingera sp. ANG-Vp]|uniref:hypothetical protein n=1 Tax=Leisingera sp. ANG-Vp TaxID=1577896 RepID=UPI00057EBF1F
MGRGHFSWGWGGGRSSWAGKQACGGNSYYNGGVQGGSFSRWYDGHLSDRYGWKGKGYKAWRDERDKDEDGTGGTKGSDGTRGSDGTKGSGG